jgi:hypothetical protein
LLLHKLARIWRDSGYEKDRPSPFVFMPNRNDVQEAVLGQWGINLITGNREDPELALIGFLEELQRRVNDTEVADVSIRSDCEAF